MSFYGNITNTSRTQFRFERTYSNRSMMDANAALDGVYIGNYVLVDYDTEMSADWMVFCYAYPHIVSDDTDIEAAGNIEFWDAPKDLEGAHRVKLEDLLVSNILYPSNNQNSNYKYIRVKANEASVSADGVEHIEIYNFLQGNEGSTYDTIYMVDAEHVVNGYPIPTVVTGNSTVTHERNFSIDRLRYNTPRGYDSTVWQKTYAGNPAMARYVMIAELNTVVPSFSVEADAPSIAPLVPHFDLNSTNFHYKLHTQAPWGFRIKSAANIIANNLHLNDEITDTESMPSDEDMVWSRPSYNKDTGEIINYIYNYDTVDENNRTYTGDWVATSESDDDKKNIPAAIYYNKDGFSPDKVSYSQEGIEDKIAIAPTGLSGQYYHNHGTKYEQVNYANSEEFEAALADLKVQYAETQVNGSDIYGRDVIYVLNDGIYTVTNTFKEGNTIYYIKSVSASNDGMSPAIDTQELSIMLPSVGNSVAKMWDIVYGSSDINNSEYRNKNIKWLENGSIYYRDNGLRLINTDDNGYTYSTDQVDTLAGSINTAHDLIGMIIRPLDADADVENLSNVYIYYDDENKKYYRKAISYVWDDDILTEYDSNDKDSEEYLHPITGTIINWPSNNTEYYYKENAINEDGTLSNKYYYILDKNYNPNYKYYILNPDSSFTTQINSSNYQAGKYYYKIKNGQYAGSWILDTNNIATEGREYYSPNFTDTTVSAADVIFYDANQLYLEPENLNQNTTYVQGEQLYTYTPLFIYSIDDTITVNDEVVDNPAKNVFSIGDKWNMNIDLASNQGIKLCKYKEAPVLIELKDFGRGKNTLNGSILYMNEFAALNDNKTRSRKTVQGVMNTMLDYVDTFKDVKANEILMSNQYGKLYSRGITLESDKWINLSEDRVTDQNNLKLSAKHTKINENEETYSVDAEQKPAFNDTFNILNDVKVDEAGHVLSIDTTTVQLPSNDIGNLTLSDYEEYTSSFPNRELKFSQTDTVNNAFKKIENYIGSTLNVSGSEGNLTYIDSVGQDNGKLTYHESSIISDSRDIRLGDNRPVTAGAVYEYGEQLKDSPALIGTPTAPTPNISTNNNQIATTEFVQSITSPLIAEQQYKTYTVKIDLNNSNPETCVEYLDDAMGKIKGDDSWDYMPIFKDINPCIFSNGEVVYYLDKNDITKKITGEDANLDGTDGDAMVEFPKFAYRIKKSNDGSTVYVSITNDPTITEKDNNYHYYAFTKESEGDREHFYLGMFLGSLDEDEKLLSISNQTPLQEPKANFREHAENKGVGYCLFSYPQLVALQCLYLIKYGNLNGQAALGEGYFTGIYLFGGTIPKYQYPHTTGINLSVSNGRKMYYSITMNNNGYIKDSIIKFAGIEDFWGNDGEWIDNISYTSNYDINYQIGTNNFTYTIPDHEQQQQEGYIQNICGNTELGFMPLPTFTGASSTYFCDYTRRAKSSDEIIFGGDHFIFVSDDYVTASNAIQKMGPFAIMTNRDWYAVGRLMYL